MENFLPILSIAFALFLLMDPIGNVPLFISILKDIDPERQKKIILRELIIALAVIIIFNFLGDLLLDFLHIDQSTLLVSGGLILFIIAIRMVFPGKHEANDPSLKDKEPFIVPLAIPLVAGPAVLAAVMLYSYQEKNKWETISAILIAWTLSTIILLSSAYLKKILGNRGLIACERLMGLLLILMSTQMLLSGLKIFLSSI